MKLKYFFALILVILIAQGLLSINSSYSPHYTNLNSGQPFFPDNAKYKSTNSDHFGNDNLKGVYTLIFFGYTNCPDYCPDTLVKVRKLFKSIEDKKINKNVNLLFISVDTKDKVSKIKKYVEYFDKSFVGIETNSKNLELLSKRVGVYYKKISNEGSIDFYDHTGAIFLTDKESKLIGIYTPPIDINNILEDVIRVF
tara:strand:+ start:163 stop:753 length:591 start_codon:yes stop_codon:yes gene_type:complete